MGKDRRILRFWFGDLDNEEAQKEQMKLWFKKDAAFDLTIRKMFGVDIWRASIGKYEHWLSRPRGVLAMIVLFDQFSRNMFRGTPGMFHFDHEALALSKMLIHKGWDKKLHPTERTFAYMPLMHSESLEDQDLCIEMFTQLNMESNGKHESNIHYAKKHREIVERFGRFPHRNKVLGRISTAEEEVFLTQPGSSF